MGKLIISRKTMEQVGVFERLKNRDITQREAAMLLGFSRQWVRKQLKRYQAKGAEGLIHKNTGKANPRKIPVEHENKALELLKEKLQGAGPTYLAEKLFELYGIKINEESMRQIMIRHGVWTVSRARPKHRKRRERRMRIGIMIQLDGSPHDWFEGRAGRCTLLVFIDDATSEIVWLEFVTGESVFEVMQATKNYLEHRGRPLEFYVDYGSVWSVNTNNPDRDKLTQFERAMQELDIKIIHARSPQAKGRVERANQTLQDRLVKEMRLRNISSIAEANVYVRDIYLAQHNARFAVAPAEPLDMHRSLESFDLHNILCIREERVIQNDYVVQYYKQLLQLAAEQPTIVRPKDRVIVSYHLDGALSISVRKTKLAFTIVNKRPEKQPQPKQYKPQIPVKPAKDHPWVGRAFCSGPLRRRTQSPLRTQSVPNAG